MRDDYAVSMSLLSAQGAAITALAPELEQVETAIRSATLPAAEITIAAELGQFRDVWSDATNAVGNALDYFGRAVTDAGTAYRITDELAALRFQRMQERLG